MPNRVKNLVTFFAVEGRIFRDLLCQPRSGIYEEWVNWPARPMYMIFADFL
jgi:hypothetical protein